MAEPKKPWSKPEVQDLGGAEDLRQAIASGSSGLGSETREALKKLLADKD